MRGKAKAAVKAKAEDRITPAYAGKSGCFVGFVSDFRDHPRVCGEKNR